MELVLVVDDNNIIGRFCLFVTFLFIPALPPLPRLKWFFMVPVWFFMVQGGLSWFFHGSRLVFHGSWSVFMVFHGSR